MTLNSTYTGQHVSLRPILDTDISYWSVWDADHVVQQYIPEPHEILSDTEQLQYFRDCIHSQDELHASIIENTSGAVIGTVSLTEINTYHGVGELGIVIGDRTVWGRGYGLQAVQLFLQYIHDYTPVVRVVAEYDQDNIGLGKLLGRAGFITECICRASRVRQGRRVDTVRSVFIC